MRDRRLLRSALTVGVLLSFVLGPLPGRAAGVSTVAVANDYLSPKVLYVDPGVTVAFDWLEGRHRLTAYDGGSFDSGERSSPNTFQVSFAGGTLRYRCTLHSSTDSAQQCHGMCGILTDDPDLDVRAPTVGIVQPRRGEILAPVPEVDTERVSTRFPVEIAGTAWDNVAVAGIGIRLWDNAGRSFDRVADCPACGNPSVGWSLEVSLLPGTYLLEAAAADTSGNKSITPRRTFIVV